MARIKVRGEKVHVWDPFVRLSHWSIVVAFAVAYVTEDDFLTLHVWAGYVIGVLVVLRILWGFVGSEHARFADFLYRPSEVVAYLRDLLSLRAKRYLGHSPAGGVTALLLWAGLLGAVGTGLVVYAVAEGSGPLAGLVSVHQTERPAADVRQDSEDDDDDDENDDEVEDDDASELWEEAHEAIANLTLLLALLHVGGVLLASYVHRENLVRAMIDGDKQA